MRFKNSNLILIAIFIISIFSLNNCSKLYKDVIVDKAKNYKFGIEDKKLKVQFDIDVDNPNSYNIKIKDGKIKLYIEDEYATEIIMSEPISLEKKSKQVYTIYLSENEAVIFKNSIKLISKFLSKDELEIRFDGYIIANAINISKKIKIDEIKRINKNELNLY